MSVSVLFEKGQTFDGKFVILESLGAGGMGEVYKCRQVGVERLVALKLLNRCLADTESSLQRFEREARILSVLDHKAIARFFIYGVDSNSVPFIAMEYVQGESLRQRLGQLGSLGWRDAVSIAIEVCAALSYAHSKSVIHRDLKPENIILSDPQRVVIIDFGLAKVADPNWDSLTRTGELIGTTNYLSPELCRGYRPDHRSDLYSLGIILYEMIAGSPPFLADHPMGVIYKHAHEAAPSLSVTDLSVPAQVNWIIARCIAKDPDDRYQSALELSSDLQALLNNQLTEIVPPVAVSKIPEQSSLAVSAIAVVVLIAAFFVFLSKPEWSKRGGAPQGLERSARRHPRKLSLSDRNLQTMSVDDLKSQCESLTLSHREGEVQDLIGRWLKAHDKESSLRPSERIDLAIRFAKGQTFALDYKSAIKTLTDAWLSVKDNPQTDEADRIRLLIALIGNEVKVSDHFLRGNRRLAPIEENANVLLELVRKNELPSLDFESAMASVIYAKEKANQLSDALELADWACRTRPESCRGLARFKAEILFMLGRNSEAKTVAREYGQQPESGAYRFAPSEPEREILASLNAAMCALPAGRYQDAMELLEPTLKKYPNFCNASYADALTNYAEWRLLALSQKSVSAEMKNAAIEESLKNLAECGRIFHVLGRCHLERQALAKSVGWQIVLGREKEAERTLLKALHVRDQESDEAVKADIASMMFQELWVLKLVSPGRACLLVLRHADSILDEVDNVQFAAIKELVKRSRTELEAQQK